MLKDLDAIDTRHLDIQDHDARSMSPNTFMRLMPTRTADCVEICILQRIADNFNDRRFVIHHDHDWFHAALPPDAPPGSSIRQLCKLETGATIRVEPPLHRQT